MDLLPAAIMITSATRIRPEKATISEPIIVKDLSAVLGVKIGDVFTFDIGGEEINAPLTSLRFIEWDSLK